MTTITTDPLADYSASLLGASPPVVDGLVGLHYYGPTKEISEKNQARDGSFGAFAWGTTPTFSANGGLLSTFYNPLFMSDFATFTNILVFGTSSVQVSTPISYGSGGNTSPLRYGGWVFSAGAVSSPNYYVRAQAGTYDGGSGSAGQSNTATVDIHDITPAGTIIFACQRFDGVNHKLYVRNGGGLAIPRTATVAVAGGQIRDTRAINVSSLAIDPTTNGPGYIGMTYSRAISDTELGTIYTFCKSIMDNRGATGL